MGSDIQDDSSKHGRTSQHICVYFYSLVILLPHREEKVEAAVDERLTGAVSVGPVSLASLCGDLEHGVLGEEPLHQGGSCLGGGALGRHRLGEGQDGRLHLPGDLRVGAEGQRDPLLGAGGGHVGERRQRHGPVHGGQRPHRALRVIVGRGLVLVLVVVMVVLVLVQVSVLVFVVQGELVVVVVGVGVGGVLVGVVLVGQVAAVVVGPCVVSVHVVVAVAVIVGVGVGVLVGAAGAVVVRVVMLAVVCVRAGLVVVGVARGVVVGVVVC